MRLVAAGHVEICEEAGRLLAAYLCMLNAAAQGIIYQ
jgi:hypothetical protein